MPRRAVHAAVAVALLGCACAGQRPLYHWDEYDRRLYEHYRSPQDHGRWVASMQRVVTAAEQEGRMVPPGIYAEYGYALLEQGDREGAIAHFQKERDLWPESCVLMDRMIAVAQRGRAAGAPEPAASPARPVTGEGAR
jgi:hypothetical protein